MDPVSSPWLPEILDGLLERRDLSEGQMRRVIGAMMSGQCSDAEIAAVLAALRCKGETAAEIAAAAWVLREHMVKLNTGRSGLLDTCGTGGDGSATFNVSTAAALTAAGAGVPVVKHGNRSISSRSGSADVLAELGVAVEGGPEWARRCLDAAGLAFCYAPHFHPAMRHVTPVRRHLRVRTLFNCLGPLANPAGAEYQLLGVGRPEFLNLLSEALARLGTKRAFLVCGKDGLDEVSLSGPTLVREVRGSNVTAHEWHPSDFGLEPCGAAEIQADGPAASASMIRAVLAGGSGPAARMVCANTAAALLAAEHVTTLAEGVHKAVDALASGRAQQVLDRLAAVAP
jgi:anthranilate phosphoribosyltransferase